VRTRELGYFKASTLPLDHRSRLNKGIQQCNNYTIYVNNLGPQNVLEVTEPVLIIRPDDGPIGTKHVVYNVL